MQKDLLFQAVDANREAILAAERHIWKNPELGYREWKTHAFLKDHFEKLGYEITEAGNIPGFYADLDTGRPGPKVAVLAELDALMVADHPDRDPQTGAAHACAHNAQCAALLGVAMALKAEHALEEMSGSIRLMAVPAEESIPRETLEELKAQGKIRFAGGKKEFIRRGFFNGVDMAVMVHYGARGFGITDGCLGAVKKRYTFLGKAAGAGTSYFGINALNAALTAISASHSLRETFHPLERAQVQSIITHGGDVVNVVPCEVTVETAVRSRSLDNLLTISETVNRAFAASAAAMKCRLIIEEEIGYLPRRDDPNLRQAFLDAARELFAEEDIHADKPCSPGCTDMGDVSTLLPVCHPEIGGTEGAGHSASFRIVDPECLCLTSAKVQLGTLARLLGQDAQLARRVVREKQVIFSSVQDYLDAQDGYSWSGEAVAYHDDGTITLKFQK